MRTYDFVVRIYVHTLFSTIIKIKKITTKNQYEWKDYMLGFNIIWYRLCYLCGKMNLLTFPYFRFKLIDIYKICRHILDFTHMTNSLLLMPRSHKLFDQPIIIAPVCHSLRALFNMLVQICSRLLLSLSSHRMSFLQWLVHLLKASLFSLCSCFLTFSCYFVTTKVYCSV